MITVCRKPFGNFLYMTKSKMLAKNQNKPFANLRDKENRDVLLKMLFYNYF